VARDGQAEQFTRRYAILKEDKHVQEQAKRLVEPLAVIRGTKDAPSLDSVIDTLAQLIAILETRPDIDQTANYGGISLTRGPMEGYGVLLHATDVFVMHLGDPANPDDSWGGKWREANDLWSKGKAAQADRRAQGVEK
jgi:hypothetical protein